MSDWVRRGCAKGGEMGRRVMEKGTYLHGAQGDVRYVCHCGCGMLLLLCTAMLVWCSTYVPEIGTCR